VPNSLFWLSGFGGEAHALHHCDRSITPHLNNRWCVGRRLGFAIPYWLLTEGAFNSPRNEIAQPNGRSEKQNCED
jgi:hypothetical protein